MGKNTEQMALLLRKKQFSYLKVSLHTFLEGKNIRARYFSWILQKNRAPNMIEKISGIFNQNYPENNVDFLKCIIHQDILCETALNIKNKPLDPTVKLINA